jgi:type I restriction enzyme R subunit
LVFKAEPPLFVVGTLHGSTVPEDSEWLTRKKLIDNELRAVVWRVTPHYDGGVLSRLDRCAVEAFPTSAGHANYALVLDGRVVGIVEAQGWEAGRLAHET